MVRPADLWYVVGLIATDGCISRDGRHVDITSADRQHLETVRRILGLKIAIGKKRNGPRTSVSYHIQIGSRDLVRFLTAIGLTPRKSLTIGPLDVPDDAFSDFLRGAIDGDGSIRTWIHPGNGIHQWALKIILRACYYPGSAALERKRDLALEGLRSLNKHRWYRDVIPRLE